MRKWATCGLAVAGIPAFALGQAYTEAFDDVATLLAPGSPWEIKNQSAPAGLSAWFQGNPLVFGPQATGGYIAANYNNVSQAGGAQSDWLFTPVRTLRNGDVFKFSARSTDIVPDRLAVRLSLNGASTNVGTTASSVGDFTIQLLAINPGLLSGGFPDVWAEHTITLGGLPGPTPGRIAFWYAMPAAGLVGRNGDYIGIDTLSYVPVGCYPDCNGDGALTVADFGCFQTRFVAGDPYADCNGDGVRTVADFGCFQTRFVAGCP
jgi:hypothetical protein